MHYTHPSACVNITGLSDVPYYAVIADLWEASPGFLQMLMLTPPSKAARL